MTTVRYQVARTVADIAVGFSAGHQSRPILTHHVYGTYVDEKLLQLREQFAGKPYPSGHEALQVLRSENPKYGPDKRKARFRFTSRSYTANHQSRPTTLRQRTANCRLTDCLSRGVQCKYYAHVDRRLKLNERKA